MKQLTWLSLKHPSYQKVTVLFSSFITECVVDVSRYSAIPATPSAAQHATGIVWLARWRFQGVAVMKINTTITQNQKIEFEKEAQVYM
jgi:hypothetical protein